MNVTHYKELLSKFCEQLGQLRDPSTDRVTAKWLRESVEVDNSPASRRLFIMQANRVAKTAYALATLAVEKSTTPLEQKQTGELSQALNDLLAEIKRLAAKSKKIDEILADRGLEMLSGETLVSVDFVLNYLKLHFDGPTLNAYNLPIFRNVDFALSESDPGYRDALCSLIGRKVERAAVRESENLEIAFEGGAVIEISLRPEDHKFQEVAELWSPTGRFWMW